MKNKEMLWKDNGVKIHDKVKIVGQVYINDYSNLKSADGQRTLEVRGVRQINSSYDRFGICSTPIVVKDKSNYIIVDGQNRIEAAKKRKWSIICSLVECSCTINELMIILNTTQNNWKLNDYLNNGIVYHENPDYMFLSQLWEDTAIPLCALYEVFSYDKSSPERKALFESGSWKASTKDFGLKIVNYVERINKWVNFSHKTGFIRGFSRCVSNENFDINHYIQQLKRFPKHVHDSGDRVSGHRENIHKIYNKLCLPEQQVTLDV